MHPFKKLGFGVIATALFAVLAMATLVNTAYAADIDTVEAGAASVTAGDTTTITVNFDATTGAVGNVVSLVIDADASTGEAQFTANGAQNITVVNNGTNDLANADTDVVQVNITGIAEGLVVVDATHNQVTESVAFEVDNDINFEIDTTTLTISRPASGAADVTRTVTATVTDEDDAGIAGEDVSCVITAGPTTRPTVRGATDTTDADGEAECEVVVADDTALGEHTLRVRLVDAPGLTANVTVFVVGAVDAVTVTTPESVAVGASGTVTIAALAGTSPAGSGQALSTAVSAGVLACPSTVGNAGTATCTYFAPSTAQTVTITAVVGTGTSAVQGTGSLVVGTTPTTPTPGTGDGEFASAPNFGTGNVGSAVFNGGTIEQLSAAVTASGGTAVWVQGTDGNWYRYNTLATGATAFVNNAFMAQFAAGFGTTAVFVVR